MMTDYDGFTADYARADENFVIDGFVISDRDVRVVASADTMTRYEVIVFLISPEIARTCPYKYMVAVQSPVGWNSCYGVNGSDLHPSYVREKFIPRSEKILNGGDLAGLTNTINAALFLLQAREEKTDGAPRNDSGQ